MEAMEVQVAQEVAVVLEAQVAQVAQEVLEAQEAQVVQEAQMLFKVILQ